MRRRRVVGLVCVAALAGCATLRPAMLDAWARDDVQRVQAYLNGLQTLQADFRQVAPNGAVSSGTAWLARPGRLRLDYAPPSQAVLVADRGMVTFEDRATGSTTTTPLARTPLSILLAPEIVLSGSVTVTRFVAGAGDLRMTLVSTATPGQGSLTLVLKDHPLVLEGLDLVDARGDMTRLVLSNLVSGVAPPVF